MLCAEIAGTSLNPIYGMSMDPLYGGIVSCLLIITCIIFINHFSGLGREIGSKCECVYLDKNCELNYL